MIVVAHFCAKDIWLAEKNLNWCITLEGKTPYHALLACDTETPKDSLDRVRELAKQYFSGVSEFIFGPPKYKTWPWAPNHCWQEVARKIPQITKDSWLWWEMDATPLRKDWLQDIEKEHIKGGKPFTGYVVNGVVKTGHMTGVGVYPNNVMLYTQQAFFQTRDKCIAWDVLMAKEIMPKVHHAPNVFQHVWAVDPEGNPTFGSSVVPSFPTWEALTKSHYYPEFTRCIYHRCKDGSIIDRMLEHITSLQPKIGLSLLEEVKEVKIEPTKVVGDCGILIVTYHKDFPWLKYCIRSIEKFCTGFSGITIAIPSSDVYEYQKQMGKQKVKIHLYDEVKNKGMVQHMERICCADMIRPKDSFVLHVDADCVFLEPVTPAEYIVNEKPVYVVRSYESLIDKNSGKTSDCLQWKAVAEKNIGEPIEIYSMCRHPTCFPKEFYPAFRKHIETVQCKPFREYVLEQKNTFPQTFAEFPAMGGWAWNHMRDKFHWIRCDLEGAPKDKMKAFWSHAGIDQKLESGITFKEWVEELLK